jgi:hypothetical protein
MAFYGAGSNKTAWIVVIVVGFFLGIGFLLRACWLTVCPRRPGWRRLLPRLRHRCCKEEASGQEAAAMVSPRQVGTPRSWGRSVTQARMSSPISAEMSDSSFSL